VLQLHTFGGVFVADAEGRPLGGAASQRRLLAVLLPLAVAGDRGVSREKLTALLWPEVGEERARHSLTQALYAARRAVNADDVFVLNAGDVRLDRNRVWTDVHEFESALRAGDLARAAALYHGPFADGFSLPGSSEFEHWCSGQRHRLEGLAASAVERLGHVAESDGRLRDAIGWQRQLVTIRPLDTAAAMRYMRALARAGDRASALQHARVHQALLREQLALEPEPALLELIRLLREGAPVVATTQGREDGGVAALDAVPVSPAERLAGPVEPEGSGTAVVAAVEPTLPAPVPTPESHARYALGPRPLLLGALALAALVFTWWRSARGGLALPPTAPTPALEQKVVVTPFRVSGASASLAYLREGIVELLSARLADDSSARSVDAGAVLAAWRAAGLADLADVPRDSILALARRLGAERVVSGSVVGNVRRVVVAATVLDTKTGLAAGSATIEVPPDSVGQLVDALAARLLLIESGEDASLAARTTGSLRALRAFLRAQAAFRRGEYVAAVAGYEEALRLDSAFALASLQLARSADRLGSVEQRTGALVTTWREQASLDARGRTLLVAQVGPRFPAPSEGAELERAWERIIDLTPDRADAWYDLGTRLLQEGRLVGDPDSRAASVTALRRAVRIDSTHAPARELLAYAELTDPQAPAAARLDTALPLAPFLSWLAATRRGDTLASLQATRRIPANDSRNARAIAREAQRQGRMADAARAVALLQARARRPSERVDAILARHALSLNAGRPQEATSATALLAEVRPGAHAHLRLRVLDAIFGPGDARPARAAARTLLRSAEMRPSDDPNERAVQLADACAVGFWLHAEGDTTRLRPIVARLRADTLAARAVPPIVAMMPGACAVVLDAGLAVAAGASDAARRLAKLDTLAFTAGAAGDGIAFVPIVLARLHAAMGDTSAALDAIRRRQSLAGWPRYLATALRTEGALALALGRAADAVPVLERYLALRQDSDAGLAAERAEVAVALDSARRAVASPLEGRPPS
jgi:DNA-binding SARP family transcriptional activator/TolB-like protein